MSEEPKLVRRRENRKSTLKIGRTIGEAREKLETKNERNAARKKDKRKKALRIIFTIIGFIIVIAILVGLFFSFRRAETELAIINSDTKPAQPKIEIIDEDSTATNGHLTNRMAEFINQVDLDLRELGIYPTKAVIPTGKVREVDFYLDGYNGYLKTTIDRGAGVTAEDAERMLRYLESIGITDFSYIDVRIDQKAFWK